MVSKGQFLGLDWNHIARLHGQVMKGTHNGKITQLFLGGQFTQIVGIVNNWVFRCKLTDSIADKFFQTGFVCCDLDIALLFIIHEYFL